MDEWIEWGYRQGEAVTVSDDEPTATGQVQVLQALGEDAELVHRVVTRSVGSGVTYHQGGDWIEGAPASGWTTQYQALQGDSLMGVFATPQEAWSALAPTPPAQPPSFLGVVSVHRPGPGGLPRPVAYSVRPVDIPARSGS